MADDLKLKGNASQLLTELERAIASWEKYGAQVAKTETATIKANKTSKETVRTLEQVDKAGKKIVTTQKKVGDSWEEQTVKITKNTKALEKQKAVAKQAAAAARQAASAAARSRQTSGFLTGVTGRGLTDPTATTGERTNVVAASNKAAQYIRQQGIELKKVQKIWRDLESGAVKRYGEKLGGLQTRLQALRKTQAALGQKTRDDLRKQEAALKRQREVSTQAWRSIAKLFAVHLAHRAISALTRAIKDGVKEAVKLQKAIAEVQTISQDSAKSTEEWFQAAKRLSNAFGVDVADQLESAYQALSNQVVTAAEATEFLASANKFAAISVSSTAESVDLLSSVINAYGKDVKDAEDISAKLFKTIELGRVRSSEMSNTFGELAVISSKLGISLEEVLASVTTLTRQGLKYNKAATQMRGIMIKLLKPSEKMKEFLADIGVESGQAAIETFGWIGFLEKLQTTTKGSATELAKYITRVRGLTGVLGLTGKGLVSLKEDFDKITNAQASYAKASDITFKNTGKTADLVTTKISNSFKSLGNDILEFHIGWIDAVTGISKDAASERLELLQTKEIENAYHEITKAFEKEQKVRTRIAKVAQAEFTVGTNKQVTEALKAHQKMSDAASVSSKALLANVSGNISRLKSDISSLTSELTLANRTAIDLAKEESQIVFDWAQESRKLPEQIVAIGERIKTLQEEQATALEEENVKAVQEIGKTILSLIKKRRALSLTADKENEKTATRRKEIEQEINEIKAKGGGGAAREIADLLKEQSNLNTLVVKRIGHEGALRQEIRKQIALFEGLAFLKEQAIKKEQQQLLIQETKREELKRLVAEINKFDITETLKLQTPEAIFVAAEARLRTLKEAIERAKDFGVDPSQLVDIEKLTIEEPKVLRVRVEGLKTLQEMKDRNTELIKLERERLKLNTDLGAQFAVEEQKLKNLQKTISDYEPKQASYLYDFGLGEAAKDVERFQKLVKAGIKVDPNTARGLFTFRAEEGLGQLLLDYELLRVRTQKNNEQLEESEAEVRKIEEATKALKIENDNVLKAMKVQTTEQQKQINNVDTLKRSYDSLRKSIQATEQLKTTVQPINVPSAATNTSTSNVSNDTINVTQNATGNLPYDARQIAQEIDRLKRRKVVS